MFNNRIFRTTPERDFLRGPMLSAYLRFEILLWLSIAVLALLAAGGQVFLPTPDPAAGPNYIPSLLGTFGFSALALAMFIAVWRFKQWGVYVLVLWTLVMVAGALVALFSPPVDGLLLLALLGLIIARGAILLFEIRPKWSAFEGGVF